MHDGYFRVAAVTPPVQPADVAFNTEAILSMLPRLTALGVEVAVMPEMCVTGYTCGDLFHTDSLLDAAAEAVRQIHTEVCRNGHIAIIIGYPKRQNGVVYNVGSIITPEGITETTKTYVPNYNEFYERRWWRPSSRYEGAATVRINGVEIGVEICEDLWAPIPPSSHMALSGAEVIFNLSASDDVIGKYGYLRELVLGQSSRCLCGYVYSGAGFGESSTDLVFDGKGMIAENGHMLAEKPRWDNDARITVADIDIEALRHDRLHNTTYGDCREREVPGYSSHGADYDFPLSDEGAAASRKPLRRINPLPFLPPDDARGEERCEDILSIQSAGLCRRLDFIKGRKLVVGISGGLDSTLALLVAVRAFDRLGIDRKGIIGVTMPGFGTTGRTHRNALTLMERLGVTSREVSIVKAVEQHFADIGHNPSVHDVTYENSQARERTQLLMDIANEEGAIVLGTGDLSELALGWATYNGDHMSMYGINAGVPKTLVSRLVRHEADVTADAEVRTALLDVLDTPISPELLPATADGEIAQVTEDLVGPYELHDFFLYQMLRFGASPRKVLALAETAFEGRFSHEVILKWLRTFYRRFFAQQFKRSCMPDGPKVGSVCLSPRGDWRMPSDASSRLWLAELDTLG